MARHSVPFRGTFPSASLLRRRITPRDSNSSRSRANWTGLTAEFTPTTRLGAEWTASAVSFIAVRLRSSANVTASATVEGIRHGVNTLTGAEGETRGAGRGWNRHAGGENADG